MKLYQLALPVVLAGCSGAAPSIPSSRKATVEEKAAEIMAKLPEEGLHYHYGTLAYSVVVSVEKNTIPAVMYDLFHKDHSTTAVRLVDEQPAGTLDEALRCDVDYSGEKAEYNNCKPLRVNPELLQRTYESVVKLTSDDLHNIEYVDVPLILGLMEKHNQIRKEDGL